MMYNPLLGSGHHKSGVKMYRKYIYRKLQKISSGVQKNVIF